VRQSPESVTFFLESETLLVRPSALPSLFFATFGDLLRAFIRESLVARLTDV